MNEAVEKKYVRLIERMVSLGAETKPVAGLFNVTGIGHKGKLILYLKDGRLVAKLPIRRVAELTARGIVELSENARSREWVVVRRGQERAWNRIADDAQAYARESTLID